MNQTSIRTLGQQESRLLNVLSSEGKCIFTTKDARSVFGNGKVNVNKLLHRLTRKRWLLRLEKGKYMILPLEAGMEGMYTLHEFVLASHLVSPYAIAYWSALHFHGFTEQVPRTVMVASPKKRQDVVVEDLGVRFQFVQVKQRKFFGILSVRLDDQYVNVTDPAKTVLDCLDHPELCGGIVEGAKGLYYYLHHQQADPIRLTDYAVRLGNRTVFKRLGYLTEALELRSDGQIPSWQTQISTGVSLLDPRRGERGPYNARWNLRLNVDARQLTDWMVH